MRKKKKDKNVEIQVAKPEVRRRHMDRWTPGLAWNRPFRFDRPFSLFRHFADDLNPLLNELRFGRETPGLLPFENEPFEQIWGGSFEWTPPVEMFTESGHLVFRAELPGMKKDDIVVEIEENHISLSGKREARREESDEGFYRSEFSYGSFYRRLPLPDGVDTTNAVATFNNGVLEIRLEAPELVPAAKRIEITERTPKTMTAKM